MHEVADGAELLLRIEDSFFMRRIPVPIDLFITDIRMPVYTGLEIVSGMREAGLEMPVVIMTAFGNLETRERAEALGATLLDKPFKMEAMRALVRHGFWVRDPDSANQRKTRHENSRLSLVRT